jgi:hypothetical protein
MANWRMPASARRRHNYEKPIGGCEGRRETKVAGSPKSWDCHDMLGVLNAGHDRLALRQNCAHAFRGLLEPPREQGVGKDEATMIEDSGRSTTKPRNWTRFAALLAVFALSFLTIRLLAGRSAKGYPTPPFFHLFFSDTIHMKAWLATGAITLGLFQVLSAARLFELFRCAPAGRF